MLFAMQDLNGVMSALEKTYLRFIDDNKIKLFSSETKKLLHYRKHPGKLDKVVKERCKKRGLKKDAPSNYSRLLRRMEDVGWIEGDVYDKENYHKSQRVWKLTEYGKDFANKLRLKKDLMFIQIFLIKYLLIKKILIILLIKQ